MTHLEFKQTTKSKPPKAMRISRTAWKTIACLRRLSKGFRTRRHSEEAPASYKVPLDTSWIPQDNHLLSLPCELLLQIVNEVSLYDIEKFALSCKQVYNLAKGLANEARECIPKYRSVLLNHVVSHYTSSTCVYNFLDNLLRRPRIGLYITTLYIWGSWPASSPNLNFDVQGLREALSSVIADSPYLNLSESQLWLDTLIEGSLDPTIAIILLFLLNIRSLTLSDFHTAACTAQVVRNIASLESGRVSSQTLSKLSSVHIARVTGAGLDLIAFFAALPSMKQISINDLHEDYFEDWSFDHQSTVTKLRIDNCNLDMDKVAALLEGFSGLESFHYQTLNRGSPQHNINPMTLCRTLIKNAGTSLERLYIGVNDVWSVSFALPTFIGSLREFQALKYLRLETRFLFRDGVIQKLVDMLPPSLESFELHPAMTTEAASAMLTDLPELKEVRLPNLRRIFISGAQIAKQIQASCKSKGVSVIIT